MTDVPQDRYTHGHHESVVQNHARRRAEVDAWFLLPRLTAGMRLLDAGCGPGTITVGLAKAVAPGEVTESTSRKRCWRKPATTPRPRASTM